MSIYSFDIVCDYDKAEMNNVFDQTQREMINRYDFRGTPATITWQSDKKGLVITGNSEWQIDTILDMFRRKLSARNMSQKVLDISYKISESNLKATKEVPFVRGLDQDKAKDLTRRIRESHPKVKTQIQGDAVRVLSSTKDDLQAVMQLLRAAELAYPISFTNFR